jgi:hypothetical protein
VRELSMFSIVKCKLMSAVIQILAQATNGLGVILENRYYGESYPFNSSTTDELAYMTTEQSLSPFHSLIASLTFDCSYCR